MFLINNILTDKSIKTLLTACVLNDFCQNLSQDASLLNVIYIDNTHSVWFNNNNINTFNRLWAQIASELHSNLLVCCFVLDYKKFYAYSQFLPHCC